MLIFGYSIILTDMMTLLNVATEKTFAEARTARQEEGWGRNAEPSERRSPAAPPENFTGGTLPAAGRRAEKYPLPF